MSAGSCPSNLEAGAASFGRAGLLSTKYFLIPCSQGPANANGLVPDPSRWDRFSAALPSFLFLKSYSWDLHSDFCET